MIVPSSACDPFSMFVISYVPILVSSSYDNSEDENPPLPTHLPSYDSFELEPTLSPQLPRWVHSTQEEVGDLVSYPSDQHWTDSQFQ
jgi:hypothetical protein